MCLSYITDDAQTFDLLNRMTERYLDTVFIEVARTQPKKVLDIPKLYFFLTSKVKKCFRCCQNHVIIHFC